MTYFENEHITLYQADVMAGLGQLADESVQCVVTSPPYWGLRDYKMKKQIGLEKTPQEYVEKMASVFQEVLRVLKKDGTVWLNLGDSHASNRMSGAQGKNGQRANRRFTAERMPPKIGKGIKPKDLIGIPWRVALLLQSKGWFLRSDIIWSKPNGMPEAVLDRPTRAHEYIFLLTKSAKYFYNHLAINEGSSRSNGGNKINGPMKARGDVEIGANKRTVWEVPVGRFEDAHFATFPPKLIEPCILAGSRPGDTVLDPFWGSGTTGEVAVKHQRKCIGIELNPEYCEMSLKRFKQGTLSFT